MITGVRCGCTVSRRCVWLGRWLERWRLTGPESYMYTVCVSFRTRWSGGEHANITDLLLLLLLLLHQSFLTHTVHVHHLLLQPGHVRRLRHVLRRDHAEGKCALVLVYPCAPLDPVSVSLAPWLRRLPLLSLLLLRLLLPRLPPLRNLLLRSLPGGQLFRCSVGSQPLLLLLLLLERHLLLLGRVGIIQLLLLRRYDPRPSHRGLSGWLWCGWLWLNSTHMSIGFAIGHARRVHHARRSHRLRWRGYGNAKHARWYVRAYLRKDGET